MQIPTHQTDETSEHETDGLENALVSGRSAFMGFLVKRLGNRADAEDVLQEFCVRVLARKDQLRDAERLDAWLYAVLRSALNDHYRKAGRRERLGSAVSHDPTRETTAPDAYEVLGHICTCVDGLIPELKPSDADLIRRIDVDGQPRKQVAADLGISAGALGVRLFRARSALRDRVLSHCGCCCEDGYEDCHCSPSGCQSGQDESSCASAQESPTGVSGDGLDISATPKKIAPPS